MEGRYRGLLEAAPDAMVVVNQAGEIVLLNVQAEKQFGYHRDELVGQQVKNIIPEGFAERLVADDLRSAEDALAQQIGTGHRAVARRKDGSEFPIEIMLSPLESADGILAAATAAAISLNVSARSCSSAILNPLAVKLAFTLPQACHIFNNYRLYSEHQKARLRRRAVTLRNDVLLVMLVDEVEGAQLGDGADCVQRVQLVNRVEHLCSG